MESSPKFGLDSDERTQKQIKDAMKELSTGKDDISYIYKEKGMAALMCCNDLLKPDNKMPPEFKKSMRKIIYGIIENYPSYTEFMKEQRLSILLTPKTKKIVKELDEIAAEIKNFANDGPSMIDVANLTKLKGLLERENRLIKRQSK